MDPRNKGGAGAQVIDDEGIDTGEEGAEGAAGAGEANDGAQDATDQEGNEAVDQPGGDADQDGGGEAGEAGADAGGEEGAAEGEDQGAESGQNGVLNEVKDMLENLGKRIPGAQPDGEPEEAQYKEPSDEEWKQLETAWDGMPRPAIRNVLKGHLKVYNRLKTYIDGQVAVIKKEQTMRSLSREPGFHDIFRHQKGIDEFLADFDERHHSNPALLKKAAIYARGLNAGKDIRRAAAGAERNKKIAGPARPASPGAGRSPGAPQPLTPAQRQAASMLPGGEKEYRGLKQAKQQGGRMQTIE